MANASYPTGVENHGGSLRIWFLYKGKRVRENLGVPDTAKNRKIAGELRSSVCFAIRMGNLTMRKNSQTHRTLPGSVRIEIYCAGAYRKVVRAEEDGNQL
jgi:hypothetical protein